MHAIYYIQAESILTSSAYSLLTPVLCVKGTAIRAVVWYVKGTVISAVVWDVTCERNRDQCCSVVCHL